MNAIKSIDIEQSGEIIGVVNNLSLRDDALRPGSTSSSQYLGVLVDDRLPSEVRIALAEYRELIDDQVFSLVDEARDRVLQFGMVARCWPAGDIGKVLDFQLNGLSVLLVVEIGADTKDSPSRC